MADLPAAICCISFPNLQRLKLCGNSISSIESLVFLRAEQLIELALSWNNIGSTRPLRKCSFPKLKYLNLCYSSLT
jgi:Leucine-rich repeat (LRR) protein